MVIMSGSRGGSTLFKHCAYIAYRACKQGFPFKVCMLIYNEKHREWCEQRREYMYTILNQMLPGKEIIIDIKSVEEVKSNV